ncbi:CUB and sushi domain-containing protein 3 [Caerostris darwini]|uniref:C3/C5 convertase n=1 Tax=Caerostris darwini TaxID=1538125 RepID=A0AAV4WX05_9ARAC|nr:CUB and sushi domain-containing protein 3 [Caerostris darwini]
MLKNDSQSVEHLLGAEKKAEERVNQARKRKHLRLRQAKEEAHAEIEQLQQEREKEFKEYGAKINRNCGHTPSSVLQERPRDIQEKCNNFSSRHDVKGVMCNSSFLRRCVGAWLFASCIAVVISDCPFPKKKLAHGRVIYEASEHVKRTMAPENYLLRYKCSLGYTLKGSKSVACVGNKWTDKVPTCLKMVCSYPPSIQGGNYTLNNGINGVPILGSSAVYSCDTGYEFENSSNTVLSCYLFPNRNAQWKGQIPVCKKKESCTDPGVSKNGSREGECCFIGSVLEYRCYEEYELVGEDKIECLPGSNWSSPRPFCKPKSVHCDRPPRIPHGVTVGEKEGDYYRPEEEVNIHCELGYRYNGVPDHVPCLENGTWGDEFGECTESICDPPEPLNHGTIPEIESSNRTEYPFNFELTYLCNKGFRLIGDSWRFCDTQKWSETNPYCAEILCPDPGVPEHGTRTGENFSIGEKVTFKCFTGYELIGSFERYCKQNGQWSGELARCNNPTNYCPDPGIPINGRKNSSSYEMGDAVSFTCSSKRYPLIGSEVRECLPSREWSGTEAKCIGRFIFYFAFDVSGSIRKINFKRSIEFAKAIVKKIGISKDGARAGALTFSSKAETEFLPLDYETTENVVDALDKLNNYTGGGTSANTALSVIREELIPLTQNVLLNKGIKSVVFVLTDGKANMGGDPKEEAKLLKETGAEIYCIGITNTVKRESLHKIASEPHDEHVFILQSYATLSFLIEEITNGTIDYSKCGLGLERVGEIVGRGRIGGGDKVAEPWPWMAALYFITTDFSHRLECGGSIINQNFVLTAAHCLFIKDSLERRSEKDVIVKLGLTNLKNQSSVKEFEVKELFIHPQYQPGDIWDYDIALLQLKRPIEFSALIRPLCLPPAELPPNSTLYRPGQHTVAAGWGHASVVQKNENVGTVIEEQLKEIILPIQSSERCNASAIDNIVNKEIKNKAFTDRMFCGGDGRGINDTCQGDSGGPLMQSQLNDDGYIYWTQVGIVSWGVGCGLPNTYGYYTHVQRLMEWITNTIDSVKINI